MDAMRHLYWLLYPFLFGFSSVLIACLTSKNKLQSSTLVDLCVAALHFFLFEEDVIKRHKAKIFRAVLFAVGIGWLVFPAMRDYSELLPERFKVTVLFDSQGLDSLLESFGKPNVALLTLDPGWRSERAKLIDEYNQALAQSNYHFHFSLQRGMTIGHGDCFFKVTKVGWSSQRYQITKATGRLTFETADERGNDIQRLQTEYELVDTDSAFITQNGFSIFYPHNVLAQPQLRQYADFSLTKRVFYTDVTAATLIPVPLLKIERTIYLVTGSHGGNIPIGYAILAPD